MKTEAAPKTGDRIVERNPLIVLKLLFLIEWTITQIFTKVKAINAPKFMREVAVTKSRNKATSDIDPTKMTLKNGVLYLGWINPNSFFGIIWSRPMTYSNLETLAWDASPEASVPHKVPARKKA